MTHPITGFFGRYRFLSNFHEQTVVLDGVEYPTNEHAFQAAKTLNPEEREIIRLAPKPADAKNLGRPKIKRWYCYSKRRLGISENWNHVRFKSTKIFQISFERKAFIYR